MKISYSEYIKKADVTVLVAETIFNELLKDSSVLKIKDVAKTASGGTPKRSNTEYYNGDIPWLKSGELKDGKIVDSEEFITELGLQNSSAKLHPKGTLLVAMYGANAGKTGVLELSASTNQAVCALYANEKVENDYLFWFFRSHRYQFIEKSKGGAQPNISQTVIKQTKIPVPSKKVQNQVALILNKINEHNKIEFDEIPERFQDSVFKVLNYKNTGLSISFELTHQLSLVTQLRQAFLREAMQGKLVAQDLSDEPASELLARIKAEKEQLIKEKKIRKGKLQKAETSKELLFEIPKKWIWCKLDDICKNITDGTHQTPTYTNKGRMFLSAQNVKPFKFMPENHKLVSDEAYETYVKNRKPEKGDLLIGRVGAGIGETAVIDQDLNFAIYVSLGLIQPFKEHLSSSFLAYLFNSPYGYSYAKGNISSKGGSAGNFNLGRIRSFLVPLAPLSEQNRIVAKLNELMNYCDQLEESIKNSQGQNEMLLGQVLREALEGER